MISGGGADEISACTHKYAMDVFHGAWLTLYYFFFPYYTTKILRKIINLQTFINSTEVNYSLLNLGRKSVWQLHSCNA